MELYTNISEFISQLDTTTISKKRKKILQPLVSYIQEKINNNAPIALNFICTHNSRRSHFSQIWAQTMAYYFNLNNLITYSGGTESTALFPMVIETLKKVGFQIETISITENPIYSIKYSDNSHAIIGFSKKLDSEFNPKSKFAAIMTCSQADEGCPFVPGAEKRIPITFDDPKLFDNTPQQEKKYMERSIQIATELLYVFSKIKK